MIPLTHVPPTVDWILSVFTWIGIFMVPLCIVIAAYWRRLQEWLAVRELRRRREKKR